MEKLINKPSAAAFFRVNNIVYQDITIPNENDLVYFGGIENQDELSIVFTNMTFSNIVFDRGGNIMHLQQLLKNPILFQNILLSNIIGASIIVESISSQISGVLTKVAFKNLTATLISETYSSFINVLTGGVLEIEGSSFANIFNTQSGAVLKAGYMNTITTIKNSVFINNTSIKGAVFDIQHNSVVVLDN